MKHMIPAVTLALAFSAGACAAQNPTYTPLSPADSVGRIYDYTRSNIDGSDPERIVVFRRSVTEVAVFKSSSKCTTAAYVTATLDPQTLEATALIAGKVGRDGTQQAFGSLDFDARARTIDARVDLPDGSLADKVAVPDAPWHLYDFDLATLTVTTPHLKNKTKDFSFGLALILVGGADPNDFMTYLGRADAHFAGAEDHNGHRALRFDIGGPAFGAKGGPLWLDAKEGHILEARFGVPNHSEYTDFRLELKRVSDGGAPEWHDILIAQYAGCPAPKN